MAITLFLSLTIVAALFFLFYRLKTPYYRVDKERMMHVLEMVLSGQATDNDWQIIAGMPIRHAPELEAIRQQCADIEERYYIGEQKPPYLFTNEGLKELKILLGKLKQAT